MNFRGSRYYDHDEFFHNYNVKRSTKENANDTIEKPIFYNLVDDVSNLNVLDLGCGDGRFGLELLEKGCHRYVGVEGSTNMYQCALKNLNEHKDAQVINQTIEDWDFPTNAFDLVTSRLVLHYLEEIESVFRNIYHSIVQGGRFIFSVEHPVITSTLQKTGLRTSWTVDQYFINGFREQEWLGSTVQKYHRTIEDYFSTLQIVGFKIKTLRESRPNPKYFIHEETYQRRLRVPLFLFFSARK
ncbi:class I SAM-dependent DNA methyltransferase [Hazenella coriacea]|uniref:Methyltransferase family protein n=1 Tax=Hazenella coriacea TaxID=1179467 RepID=A0A4R3LAV1_9BACL|nr:class I SAM-dependent methyltransferase [Hazenella coriacea]TCS96879.1 methyltransferase family protein [Hazenella coriacea]